MTKKCAFCSNTKFRNVLNLGMQPLANSYLSNSSEFKFEKKVKLSLEMCLSCKLCQVPHNIYPKDFFLNYDYLSGASTTWIKHCKDFSQHVIEKYSLDKKNGEIMEIASNDGVLLDFFKKKNFKVVVIEPSVNAVKIARKNNIRSIVDFFDYKFAKKNKNNFNPQLIIANNVIAHIKNLNSFVKGLYEISNNKTLICIEIPHIYNLYMKSQFDTIYHEHHYYYSLHTLKKILEKFNINIVDVELIKTHGGSLRIFAKKNFISRKRIQSIEKILKKEKYLKIDSLSCQKKFRSKVLKIKKNSLNFIKKTKKNKKIIDAYGAAAKGNTMLNYLGIRNNKIRFIYDANKLKQNKYLPGTHIKILNPAMIKKNRPDYIIILPWNVKTEIIKQLKFAKKWNCKFITLIPKISIN